MSKTPQLARYGVMPGSGSGHDCCFRFTVVDTQDPEALKLAAAPDAPPDAIGAKMLCECFDEAAAQSIAAALNAIHEAQQRILASMPPEARAFVEELKAFVSKPGNEEGNGHVH
jgi:hypothetical protein